MTTSTTPPDFLTWPRKRAASTRTQRMPGRPGTLRDLVHRPSAAALVPGTSDSWILVRRMKALVKAVPRAGVTWAVSPEGVSVTWETDARRGRFFLRSHDGATLGVYGEVLS